jgi:RNA polymerase sigma factor (sigma-70 family)
MGTKDYEIYLSNRDCKEKLVFAIYSIYKPLIEKLSRRYYYNSGGRIEADDFQSEVYLKLYYFVNYIKSEKINPDTFMFYIYVMYAISSVLKSYKKVHNSELLLLSTEEGENQFASPENESLLRVDLDKFYSRLTSRQKEVLKQKQLGKTTEEIGSILNTKSKTVNRDIRRAKEIAHLYF